MNLNVRKGDNVKVLTGKDKGKTGKILATDPQNNKVLVEGVNISTHHLKARSATEPSSIKKVEAPIDASNVQIICPSCGKAARVKHQVIDGKNARICIKCGASLDAALKAEKTKKKADKADKKSKKKADKVEDNAVTEEATTETAATETAPKKTTAKKTTTKKSTTATADGEKKPAAKKTTTKKTTAKKTTASDASASDKE